MQANAASPRSRGSALHCHAVDLHVHPGCRFTTSDRWHCAPGVGPLNKVRPERDTGHHMAGTSHPPANRLHDVGCRHQDCGNIPQRSTDPPLPRFRHQSAYSRHCSSTVTLSHQTQGSTAALWSPEGDSSSSEREFSLSLRQYGRDWPPGAASASTIPPWQQGQWPFWSAGASRLC